jgi:hypothetical protein
MSRKVLGRHMFLEAIEIASVNSIEQAISILYTTLPHLRHTPRNPFFFFGTLLPSSSGSLTTSEGGVTVMPGTSPEQNLHSGCSMTLHWTGASHMDDWPRCSDIGLVGRTTGASSGAASVSRASVVAASETPDGPVGIVGGGLGGRAGCGTMYSLSGEARRLPYCRAGRASFTCWVDGDDGTVDVS